MCNPAEQLGDEYASDPKSCVSETEHLCVCAATNAGTTTETDEATDNCCNSTSQYSSQKVLDSGQENVMNGSCCQIVNEDMRTPNPSVQDYPETSVHSFSSDAVNFNDDAHLFYAENRGIETMPMDKRTSIEDTFSETTNKWIEEMRFEKEALQPTSKGTALEPDTQAGISKDSPEQACITGVEVPNSTSVSCADELVVRETEEVMIDPCESAVETQMRTNISYTGHEGEDDDMSLLVGIMGGSVDNSKGPSLETDDTGLGTIPGLIVVVQEVEQVEGDCKPMEKGLMLEPAIHEEIKEHVPVDFKESSSWIEMRPGTSDGVAEQLATNFEETPSGVMQQTGQVIKEILMIDQHMDTSVSGAAMSSKEAAAEHATQSFEGLGNNVVKQGVVFTETRSEIQQESSIVSSVRIEATDMSVSKGINGPELAEFFNNARASKLEEEEIKEQDQVPLVVKLPPKKKTFMESPRSLRMLLFSNETPPPIGKDDDNKKDGKSTGFSGRAVSEAESNGKENHTDDNYSMKWNENVENADMSSAFSIPITFSGALTYQGMISYSGQVAYSGSISHRSDSSTSTRSFAFPILASDWNTSPVKMGAPDPRFFRRQRKWHLCFCCRRPSTLYD